jgi:hypothetical protein
VVGAAVVVVVVLPGAGLVRVKVIGVPFRNPVTTALESGPKKSLNWLLILSTTLLLPWLDAKVFIFAASVFKSEFISA